MDEIKFCLDTYALVEIKLGNPKFNNFLNSKFVVNDITLAEFYSVLLREENEATSDYWFKKFENYSIPVSREILKKAVKFRHENKKRNLSFFDCVGYIFAIENNMKFVTGDRQFEDREGVEYIKKD